MERFLGWAGYTNVQVLTDSKIAIESIRANEPDIILLDLHMPDPDGYAILEMLRGERSAYQFIPVLVFTADGTPEARSRALEAGASDFLTKPGDLHEILLRVRNFLETRRLHLTVESHVNDLEVRVEMRTAELTKARQEAMEVLARTAEFRDDDTGQHTQRVGELSARIAAALGAPPHYVEAIRLAAPLHDVGKVGLTDTLLLKPGKFDDEEFAAMKKHTTMGSEIFGHCESPLMALAREIALHHHERWDGSGYPTGLAGEAIPLAARIVAVADVYDALTNARPYKRAWTHEEAMSEMMRQKGRHFDPAVMDAFVDITGFDEMPMAA